MEVGIKYKKQVHVQTRESILKTFAIFLENVYVYFLFFVVVVVSQVFSWVYYVQKRQCHST